MDGVWGLLRASMHIVMHNFCQFLPSTALLLLLLCYAMAVAVVNPISFDDIAVAAPFLVLTPLGLYLPACRKDPANPNSSPNSMPDPTNPSPNPNPNPSNPFHFEAFRESSACVLVSIFAPSVLIILNRTSVLDNRLAMAVGLVCGGFLIFLVLELMMGFVYAALTLHRLANFCPIVEESRSRVQAMERWSFALVRSSMRVMQLILLVGSTIPFLLLLDYSLGVILLAHLTHVWKWIITCASVGLPALLFLYIRSTQVTLYLACKTYHKECKETLIMHTN